MVPVPVPEMQLSNFAPLHMPCLASRVAADLSFCLSPRQTTAPASRRQAIPVTRGANHSRVPRWPRAEILGRINQRMSFYHPVDKCQFGAKSREPVNGRPAPPPFMAILG